VLEAYGDLLAGALLTLQLSASAMLLGLVVAIICAWAKTSGPKPLRWVVIQSGLVTVVANSAGGPILRRRA
jgi:ABC-type amino acid transport system permease subunit